MKNYRAVAFCILLLSVGCTEGSVFSPSSKNKDSDQVSPVADSTTQQVEEKEIPLISKAVGDEEIIHAFNLKEGEAQMTDLCQRNVGKTNLVIQKFCVEKIRPKSLNEMQVALNLDPSNITNRNSNGAAGNPGFAMQGHSSSLVGQFVSSINPRVVIFNNQTPGGRSDAANFIAMGFVRGEQFAEIIVANDNGAGNPDLFLVAFKQACNAKPEGCSPGELLTPAVESNWTEFTVYQDEDLKNTIVDCRHCHQPEGLDTPVFGRMQELRNPWVHWMRDNRNNGQVLLDDYFAAHGTAETYGGVPGAAISASDPANLQDLIENNNFNQAQIPEIEFQTQTILNEVAANSNGAQPADNSVSGVSATWEQLFTLASTGVSADGRNIIPIPYHDTKVTEPSLLTKYTQQDQGFVAGTVTLDQFEDHRDIFKVDQTQRANMGFAVRSGTPPTTMLTQACFQCHNSKLDQSLTRAKFNVDFTAMGDQAKAEIDIAIERLRLGYSEARLAQEGIKFVDEKTGAEAKLHKGEHVLTMPPRRFKSLTDEQIDSLIAFLKAEQAKLP